MSRAKLFNMIKARGTQDNGRNRFDLTNRHAYGCNSGYITPIKAIHTIPDDYFDINVSDFCQTNPMATAAFLRARREIAAYFVPYNTIWHNFNQYQATREDPQSVVLREKGISYEPRIALYDLYWPALIFFRYYIQIEYQIKMRCQLDYNNDSELRKQMSFEQYFANQKSLFLDGDVEVSSIPFMNTSYSISDNSFANSIVFEPFHPQSLRTFALRDLVLDTVNEYKWCNWLRKLDMLGYGNIYPYFATCESDIANFYANVPELSDTSVAGFAAYSIERMELLIAQIKNICCDIEKGDDGFYNYSSKALPGTVKYVSVYPLFAYNHIFYTMFRNSYFDNEYHPRNFNVDYLDCSTLSGSIVRLSDIPLRFYNLECHQWKKDIFTGVLPDTQYGAVSSLTLSGTLSNIRSTSSSNEPKYNILSSAYNGQLVRGSVDGEPDGYDVQQVINLTGNSSSSLNVLALRRAECLQQYRQDLLRAGNHTSDIFKQIYGADPKSQLNEHSYFVDVMGSDVIVDPIVASANTGTAENGSLGDIAGRALVNGDGKFKFSCQDFGCLIFLGYIVPESMYNSYRIDTHLMNLTPEDHFIPQLMNLGFEPIIGESLNSNAPVSQQNVTRGYTLPYSEFKTDIDLCHCNFVDFYDAGFSGITIPSSYPDTRTTSVYEGSLSHWVVPRTDMQLSKALTLRNFYIDPSILNNVFLNAYDGTYETDQFICYTSINVDAIRQLSELGLPRFC